jgi:hypothetical protein
MTSKYLSNKFDPLYSLSSSSSENLSVTYSINDRPTVLEEANILLVYTYGTSEREISEKYETNVLVQTKYYLGDYIEIHDHVLNTIQKVHYIPTAGAPVVKIIDQNNNNQTFYLYTDHLGTPTKVSDDQRMHGTRSTASRKAKR